MHAQSNDPYAMFMEENARGYPILEILNKINIGFSMGYGRTFYRHDLPGYGVINKDDSVYQGLFLFSSADTAGVNFTGYSNWLNAPSAVDLRRFENIDDNTQVNGDTVNLGYKGSSGAVPFTLTLTVDVMERFRVGAGIAYEIHNLPEMSPFTAEEILGKYVPDAKRTGYFRYFATLGGQVYDYLAWTYFVDVQIGKVQSMGKAYDMALVSNGLYFNIGAPIEYEFSEYLHGFVRPSFEYKNYKIDIGGIGAITHLQPAFYVHFGFRYNIPEIPRCKLKANTPIGYDYPDRLSNKTCRIQKKHLHGDLPFRGQPFYKEQNPKIGENYPNLHKYKWFNRRKMGGG